MDLQCFFDFLTIKIISALINKFRLFELIFCIKICCFGCRKQLDNQHRYFHE